MKGFMRFSTSPTGPITLIARSLPADLDALSSSMYRLLLIVMDPDLTTSPIQKGGRRSRREYGQKKHRRDFLEEAAIMLSRSSSMNGPGFAICPARLYQDRGCVTV